MSVVTRGFVVVLRRLREGCRDDKVTKILTLHPFKIYNIFTGTGRRKKFCVSHPTK